MSTLSVRQEQVLLEKALGELRAFEHLNMTHDQLRKHGDVQDTVMNGIRELGQKSAYARWYWRKTEGNWVPRYYLDENGREEKVVAKIEVNGNARVNLKIKGNGHTKVSTEADAKEIRKMEICIAKSKQEDDADAADGEHDALTGSPLEIGIEVHLKGGRSS
ncbi:hypothetical protein P171DRAFT_488534 [Karstenula rhodostoma CBS 690.94]|uniref:Uncharacterized protein n=1 Tax=Karstenula rhodostoma CBS 690.94 TaxID=1392251 RepID=A0A9P4PCQ2_9PLEO|nr:hypothetical protein P171DRAFT_488534 [Karstenula rhodostoma CBS 690.94]